MTDTQPFIHPFGPVPLDEYRRLVEHHIECETIATRLAESVKVLMIWLALASEEPSPPEEDVQAAGRAIWEALDDFDAHQWPEADRPNLADAIAHLNGLKEALSSVRFRFPGYRIGTEPTAAQTLKHHFDLIEHSLKHMEVYMDFHNPKPAG